MATPHVTGCAALLKARNPTKSGSWIATRLVRSAVRLPAMRGKRFTAAYGDGLVSVVKAL